MWHVAWYIKSRTSDLGITYYMCDIYAAFQVERGEVFPLLPYVSILVQDDTCDGLPRGEKGVSKREAPWLSEALLDGPP